MEIHIRNDGFRQSMEMLKRSALMMELANIKGNTETQANLSVAKADKKTLVEELN